MTTALYSAFYKPFCNRNSVYVVHYYEVAKFCCTTWSHYNKDLLGFEATHSVNRANIFLGIPLSYRGRKSATNILQICLKQTISKSLLQMIYSTYTLASEFHSKCLLSLLWMTVLLPWSVWPAVAWLQRLAAGDETLYLPDQCTTSAVSRLL